MPYDGGDLYVKVEAYLNGSWVEITSRARGGRAASGVEISYGRGQGAVQAESSRLSCTLGNADGYLTEGNPLSPWWPYFGRGTRIRVSLVGILVSDAVRFDGQIDTMVAVYPGGSDSSLRVTAIGALGAQLGRGSDTDRAALERTILSENPAAFWTMSDGNNAALGGSAVTGGIALRTLAGTPVFGTSDDIPAGVGATVIDLTNASMMGQVTGGSSTAWTVEFCATVEDAFEGGIVSVYFTGGSWGRLDIYTPFGGSNGCQLVRANGASATGSTWSQGSGWHHYAITGTQAGSATEVRIYLDGVDVSGNIGAASTTLGSVTRVDPNSLRFPLATMSMSTLAVHNSVLSNIASHAAGMGGYVGEQAHERVQRVCDEEGIDVTITGSSSPTMGAQETASAFEVLVSCETVGQGLLADGGSNGGVTYRTLSDIYNQSAVLAISRGSLDVDVAPIWDNREIRNDVTASRPGGASARASNESHITLIRRRMRDSVSANTETDDRLGNQAMWRVNVGTVSGPRYDSVGINMRNPDGARLADTVLGVVLGDRMTAAAATLPPQHPPGGIDSIIVGWAETLDADKWLFEPVCRPYSPHVVGVYGADAHVSRYDSRYSTLSTSYSSTATSLVVNIASGPLWITSAAFPSRFPFDIDIAGLTYSCTGITGSSSPQTFTIVRLGTGLDKTLPSGSEVHVHVPGRYAL